MENECSHRSEGRYDRGWALCGTLLLHALLILVLSSRSSFEPSTGSNTSFDIIWLSPSSDQVSSGHFSGTNDAIAEERETRVPEGPQLKAEGRKESGISPAMTLAATASPGLAEGANNHSPLRPVIADKMPTPAPVQSPEAAPDAMAISLAHAAEEPVSKQKNDPKEDAPDLVQQKKEPSRNGAGDAETTRNRLHKALKKRRPLEKQRDMGVTLVQLQQAQPPEPVEEPVVDELKRTAPVHKPLSAPAPKHVAPQPPKPPAAKPVHSAAQVVKPVAPPPAKLAASAPRTEFPKPAAPAVAERVPPSGNASKPGAGVPAAAKTVTPPKQQEKPAGPTGFVVASLSGDLKMVIEGESQIVVLVTFREYPKARRGKPQSRSEASRVQRVVPLFARTRQQTREAVIETAREGVYTFRAGSESGEPVKGNFTLRIFGNSKPEKIAPIGPRTVSAGTVVAKVLMPEGILWEDDSAFTGSLEDSDSSTKFNSETGLYWKEYHE